MAKRKVVSRVSPEVPTKDNGTVFDNLESGDAFIFEGDIWMKCDCGEQEAILLRNGAMDADFCERAIGDLVDIKITWTKK